MILKGSGTLIGTEKFIKILVTHSPLKCSVCLKLSFNVFKILCSWSFKDVSKIITTHQYQTSTTDHKFFMLPFETKVGTSNGVHEMLALLAYATCLYITNIPQQVGIRWHLGDSPSNMPYESTWLPKHNTTMSSIKYKLFLNNVNLQINRGI